MGGGCYTHGGDRKSRRVSFGKQLQEDLGADGRNVWKLVLNEQNAMWWGGFMSLRIGAVGGACKHGNDTGLP
jgi:hypothetical protein